MLRLARCVFGNLFGFQLVLNRLIGWIVFDANNKIGVEIIVMFSTLHAQRIGFVSWVVVPLDYKVLSVLGFRKSAFYTVPQKTLDLRIHWQSEHPILSICGINY
jgi:hypothetical protein